MLAGWKHRSAGLRNHVPPPRWRGLATTGQSPDQDREVSPDPLYVYGLPGNLAHVDDVYQSLLPWLAGENAKALSLSLDNTTLDTTRTITAGHDHTDAAYHDGLTWMQLGSWQAVSSQGLTANRPGLVVSATSDTDYFFGAVVLPSGLRYVVPRIRYSTAGSTVYLTARVRFYAPSALFTVSVDGGQVSGNTATSDLDGWLEGGASDVSGIATTNSRRVVYVKLSASVNTSTATLYGFQLGLRWGL
jgi:hypothetical protein